MDVGSGQGQHWLVFLSPDLKSSRKRLPPNLLKDLLVNRVRSAKVVLEERKSKLLNLKTFVVVLKAHESLALRVQNKSLTDQTTLQLVLEVIRCKWVLSCLLFLF